MSKKTLLVEIIKTTAWVWKQWEIKEVGLAQARNQLIPRGIAKEAKGLRLDKHEQHEKQLQNIHEQRHQIVEKLRDQALEATVEGHGSRISHHFDQKDVVELIKRRFQVKILPEMIQFEDVKHPKKAGEYQFHIDIAADAYVRMRLVIEIKNEK